MTNKFRLLSFFALGFSLLNISCDQNEQDDYTKGNLPVFTVTTSATNVDEGQSVMVTLTPSFVSNEDVSFKLSVKDGSVALDMEDFEIHDATGGSFDPAGLDWGDPNDAQYRVIVPKNSASYTFSIDVLVDDAADENEIASFSITPAGYYNGKLDVEEFQFTINNVKSDVVTFIGGWDREFDFSGSTYSLCEIGYDMDFLYADDMGNIIDYFGSYDQCPETAEVSMSDWGDGTWHVYNTVYDNASLSLVGISPAFDIPVTVEFSRPGSQLMGSYTQEASDAYDSNTPSDATASDYRYCYSFTIDNTANTVTVFNMNTGLQIGTGKMVASPKKAPKLKGFENLVRN